MSLKCAWKNKINIVNLFDEAFLKEKDIALQSISFLFAEDNNLNKEENGKRKSTSSRNNLSLKNKKEEKNSQKTKETSKLKKIESPKRRKSLNTSDLYSSNIVIVTDNGSGDSSFNRIEREVEKLKKMMTKSRSKKGKRKSNKKELKQPNSAKY